MPCREADGLWKRLTGVQPPSLQPDPRSWLSQGCGLESPSGQILNSGNPHTLFPHELKGLWCCDCELGPGGGAPFPDSETVAERGFLGRDGGDPDLRLPIQPHAAHSLDMTTQ